MTIRRVVLPLVLLAFTATTALAAPMKGKVTSIEKDKVRVVVAGKLAEWIKKGSKVRFLSARGMIAGVSADTVSITTPKASQAKVGQEVTLEKPRPGVSGC